MPLQLALELRKLGHDVLTVAESGNAGVAFSDQDVLTFALRERRVVVTLNRRHFIHLHESGYVHAGIVVCTFDLDHARQARAIHELLADGDDSTGRLYRVNRPPA